MATGGYGRLREVTVTGGYGRFTGGYGRLLDT